MFDYRSPDFNIYLKPGTVTINLFGHEAKFSSEVERTRWLEANCGVNDVDWCYVVSTSSHGKVTKFTFKRTEDAVLFKLAFSEEGLGVR